MSSRNGPGRLVATGDGWVGYWNGQAFGVDREMSFTSGATLSAACGIRCRPCARYIMWVYEHPTVGAVLVRRLPAESTDPGDALTFLASTAKRTSEGNVKADTDSQLSRLDGTDGTEDALAWCAQCRGWRTITLNELRTALANKKATIRATSVDTR